MSSDLLIYTKAALLGLMVAMPVGPVGLLIIQRSLAVGSTRGIASGLGAALADGLFGFLAAMGLVALLEQLEAFRHFVRPLGSLALIMVGLFFFFKQPPSSETEEVLSGPYRRYYVWDTVSTFFLTLMNPATIIAFAALFAGSDLIPEDPRRIDYLVIALGVFTGSLCWWLILVVAAKPLKNKLSPHVQHRILQGLGVVLLTIAILSLAPRFFTTIDKIRAIIR